MTHRPRLGLRALAALLASALASGVGLIAATSAPAAAAELPLGPTVVYTGQAPTGYSVTFRYAAPAGVSKVQIYGEWLFSQPGSIVSQTTADLRFGQDWKPGDVLAGYNNAWRSVEMTKGADGIWSWTTPLPSGTFSYQFTHDCAAINAAGCTRYPDPVKPSWSAGTPGAGVQTLSQVYVPQSSTFPTYDNRYQSPAAVTGTLVNRGYPSPLSTNPVGTHRVSVYLPPGYDAARAVPYPTLYLSHGAGGNDTDWTTQGVAQNILDHAIADKAAPAMVIVSTDFNGLPGGNQGYADELRTHVIPFVQSQYNVSTKATDRAFGGLSAGGGRANTILYDNTDLFGYYGSWSAASNLQAPTAEQAARMRSVPGAIHMGAGLQDFLANINANSISRVAALRAAGVPVTEVNFSGIHSWDIWRQELDNFLRTTAFRTTTTSVAAPATAPAGAPTTLRATVRTVTTSASAPTGQVTFFATRDGRRTALGSAPLAGDGTAALTTTLTGAGNVAVTAEYAGGTALNPSTSTAATVAVVAGASAKTTPTVKLKASPKATTTGGPRVRLVVKVTAPGTRPFGPVSLKVNGKVLERRALTGGKAVFRLDRRAKRGTYRIRAVYAGDLTHTGARSPAVIVKVARR